MAHAILSPSAASRWLNCTKSARLEQEFPDKGSTAAAEGTLAHHYGELIIRNRMGWPEEVLPKVREKQFKQAVDKVKADKLYNTEMDGYCEDYAVFVMERLAEAQAKTSDAMLFLEQKLDLTKWVPEGFGTSDCCIIADGVMETIDLKYGKGVPVDAVLNKQMMLYALGALESFGFLYDIHTVRMTIYQPRIDNISTWEIEVADLMEWADGELTEKARLAFDGAGDFLPGKHCQFCKAKPKCRALHDYNMELAKHEFKKPDLLADEDIAEVLNRVDLFKNWLKAVEEHALEEAVKNNKLWPGYKVVEGRSVRKYTDEKAVLKQLEGKGFALKVITEPVSILSISKLEKTIGKDNMLMIADYVVKPPGKPTLVPVSDKRPQMNTAEAAAADFAEYTDSE